MRINFVSQSKDNSEQNFYNTLAKKLGMKTELMKLASKVAVEKPQEIVKEGLVLSYRPNGEYTIRLGNKADIVVKGVAKQEKDFQDQVRNALAYIASVNPNVATELKKIEAAKRDILVYKDIDRCRDCVFYESDTSHETYRDKCKNCTFATLGGCLNNFMPRSMQIVVYTPDWNIVGDVAPSSDKKAFQGSFSLLDAHRQGKQDDRNPKQIAQEIIQRAWGESDLMMTKRKEKLDQIQQKQQSSQPLEPTEQELLYDFDKSVTAVRLGTELLKYFKDNNLNFQKYGKAVIGHIEQESGIQIHTEDKQNKTISLAVDKEKLSPNPKFIIEKMEVNDNAKVKIKMKDKTTDKGKEKKEAGLSRKAEGDVSLQKYERVHIKSDPQIKGTFMQVQDSKPADVDDVVVLDEAFEGHNVIEIAPVELESEGMANDEQKATADQQYAEYKEQLGKYENEGFSEKVEEAIESKDIEKKEASKKDKECSKVPGAMPKVKQEALEKYEKEPKDNYIKSKEIMPKGSEFAGTLCLAELK